MSFGDGFFANGDKSGFSLESADEVLEQEEEQKEEQPTPPESVFGDASRPVLLGADEEAEDVPPPSGLFFADEAESSPRDFLAGQMTPDEDEQTTVDGNDFEVDGDAPFLSAADVGEEVLRESVEPAVPSGMFDGVNSDIVITDVPEPDEPAAPTKTVNSLFTLGAPVAKPAPAVVLPDVEEEVEGMDDEVDVPSVPTFKVNPLFADAVPEQKDDTPASKPSPSPEVVTPQVNPLFADADAPVVRKPGDVWKTDEERALEDPERLPVYRKTGPVLEVAETFEKKKQVPGKKKRKKRPFQVQERDIILLRFLTKYQFSYVDALARLVNTTPAAVAARLKTLEDNGLVKRYRIAAGATLWQARKSGIELAGMTFKEGKDNISFATVQHSIGIVNIAAELERNAPDAKDVLMLGKKFGEEFPVRYRHPAGIRLYGEDLDESDMWWGEMTVSEREIRQGQKRYRGGKSSAEMRELVDLALANPHAPELEDGHEGLFVVYGGGGQTGEHVPDLVVTRPRNPDGTANHFAVELELNPKPPADWKRILRGYRDAGGMFSRVYYFTDKRGIANMIRNADEEVGLGDRLVILAYSPKNKRAPFLG